MEDERENWTSGAAARVRIALVQRFPAEVRRVSLAMLALFVLADATIASLCPLYGGDCLYGLFTLVVAPVIAAGVLGVLVPRAARVASWGAGAAFAMILAGGAAALALVGLGHVVAIGWANAIDYGGILVKPRLLAVTLGLALTYYAALAAIGWIGRPVDR